ncbi:hypothetical protein BJV82DRAFT_667742 [Fennellomyces sp. T-0311]|nr:hypothetical protein BJV82DRAFT_667742 [Fennellomyces sp. T-0311]
MTISASATNFFSEFGCENARDLVFRRSGTPDYALYIGMSLPQHVAKELINATSEADLKQMEQEQTECLAIYQSTHQRLEAFNEFSKARYQNINKHFESHTAMLKGMKHDLDSVFAKLRKIKSKLEQKYPEEMRQAQERHPPAPIDED